MSNIENKGNSIQSTAYWNQAYWPTGGVERAYLLLELKGDAKSEASEERAPMNISLVLDRSGSMSGAPLAYSKKACQFVTDQLNQQDKLSLVAFDDEVQTVISPSSVTHKDIMKQQIESIQAGGTTNLSGGMLQGIQYVVQGKQDRSVNRVILLSDGHANEGLTDPAKLQAIAKEFHSMGIGITAMGVGDGFDEELMEGIADHGGGSFYYIDKPEDIPGIFSKELDGLLSVIGQNVTLTIKPSEFVVIHQVYGYNAEHIPNGLKLSLGDIYDKETKSILIELQFYPQKEGEQTAFELQWDYVDVTSGAEICTLQQKIDAAFTSDINLISQQSNAYVDKQIKITQSAIVIENAIAAFDSGDEESGKMMLQEQADTMLREAVQSEDAELREEAQMLYEQLENFSFTSGTRKKLHEQKYRQMKRKK